MKKLGSVSYTLWAGQIPNDSQSGFLYGFSTSTRVPTPDGGYQYNTGISKVLDNYGGWSDGADLRWNTPLKGLVAGVSGMQQHMSASGHFVSNNLPYKLTVFRNGMAAYYVEYTIGNRQLAGEYRRQPTLGVSNTVTGATAVASEDTRSGYVSAAYRISKWVELGTYHSRFVDNWRAYHGDPQNHLFDQAVSARLDLNRFLDLKLEGHFMGGAMISSLHDRGFYAAVNPDGVKPQTNMCVLRLGFHM
jgi:hypothetical protein